MFFNSILVLILFTFSSSFINKNIIPIPNLLLKPNFMIDYLISLKEYTIISVGEKNRDLENLLTEKNFKVYYVNMENLLDYKELVQYLNIKYKNYNSGEDLWVFYKGFFIGSREDIYSLIKNKK